MEYIISSELKDFFSETERVLRDLQSGKADVRLRIVDVATNEKMKRRKEESQKAKEYAVKQVHITSDGTPRSIHERTKNGKTLWVTRLPGKKDLTAATHEALIDKLYDFYRDQILLPLPKEVHSIESEFQNIMTVYKIERNPSDNTVRKHEENYKRFLRGTDFAKKELTEITDFDVQKFTLDLVQNAKPQIPAKAFDGYVSLINLIFRNAKKTRPALISTNPVIEIDFSVYKTSCDQTKAQSNDKILAPDEIERIKEICLKRISRNDYYIRGYMILLAIETGMRVGELCSLKWTDIIWSATKKYPASCIHIHTQQLSHYDKNGRLYYTFVPWTKNEKGKSRGGRQFPMTKRIRELLTILIKKQKELGIYDENGYVFMQNGEWISSISYEKCLKRICKSLGYEVTNNHALRMSLNSNVFIPKRVPVTVRALWLGHSVRVNLENYSFAEKDDMQYASLLDDEKPDATENMAPAFTEIRKYENSLDDEVIATTKIVPIKSKASEGHAI